MSGPRAPYQAAVGVVAQGAFADLLVVEGDPAASLDFMIDPEAGLRLVIKNGQVYKNTLPQAA
jgi:imidazolonepropionase-like amidohydrolase